MLNKTSNYYFNNVISYLFLIITFLQCNSVYMYSIQLHISKGIINVLWQLLLIIILYLALINNKNNKKCITNNPRYVKFILIFSIIAIFFIVYEFIFFTSFSKAFAVKLFVDMLLLITLFYYLYYEKKLVYLFVRFENVVIFFSLISLIFWIAFMLKIPTNTPIFVTWGLHHTVPGYFGIDFFAQTSQQFLGISWVRNSGIFTEASMFAYTIIFALLIELFMRKHNNELNCRIIILLITVISTASTTGILVSFIAFVYYIIILNKKISISNIILICIAPIIFIFLKTVFLDKSGASQVNSLGSSSSVRYDDVIAGFKAWKYHLLLGCGLGKNELIDENMSSWRFTNPLFLPKSSAGFSTILAEGGILLGMFYVLPAIIVSRYSSKMLGLALFSFIPFVFVISQGFYIYLMILAYFWTIFIININKNDRTL